VTGQTAPFLWRSFYNRVRCSQTAPITVQVLIIEELRHLHEGILARYGLRPPEFTAW